MNKELYADKVGACWAGKCLGGAIGMPYEGVPYRPHITEKEIVVKNVPNDDLEMQLIWLSALEKYGTDLGYDEIGTVWRNHIPAGCDEYSIAIRNLKHGVNPPVSGWLDNCFADGMGASIRSEIWAAVFAGRPDAAAHFAALDACVDHHGDGVYGEVFMALAECKAFETSGIEESLRFALNKIPEKSRLAKALRYVFELYETGLEEVRAGDEIRARLNHPNFTDCVMNLSYVVYALLYGKGDFLKTILLAVNMGRDADCTGATAGAFLGICNGKAGFPESLLEKLNDKLILSPYVEEVPGVALTLSDTVARTSALHDKLMQTLSAEEFTFYEPYRPTGTEPEINRSEWLVADPAECDTDALEKALLENGRVPEKYPVTKIRTSQIQFDLSQFAHEANTLELFSFLTVGDTPDSVIVSATADVGMTLWIGGERLLNHHSRQLALPSFHRAEGGSAFAWHFPKKGKRLLVRVKLYYCLPPLRCSVMFGDLRNNHLDGWKLSL